MINSLIRAFEKKEYTSYRADAPPSALAYIVHTANAYTYHWQKQYKSCQAASETAHQPANEVERPKFSTRSASSKASIFFECFPSYHTALVEILCPVSLKEWYGHGLRLNRTIGVVRYRMRLLGRCIRGFGWRSGFMDNGATAFGTNISVCPNDCSAVWTFGLYHINPLILVFSQIREPLIVMVLLPSSVSFKSLKLRVTVALNLNSFSSMDIRPQLHDAHTLCLWYNSP